MTESLARADADVPSDGPSRPDPVVEAAGVRVRYDGGRWIAGGIDLTVRPGEFVLLLGPSGCGKSTFSLTVNGLVPHSVPAAMRGTVRVAGVDTAETTVGELSADVGMVFQDPDAQVVTGRVLDEVCFGLENQLRPVEEIEPLAREALAMVGLADRADDDPLILSGGQRQRLALACALAMRPAVLVLDEPTANLDAPAAYELYRDLAALVRDSGAGNSGPAVLLIEHNLDDVISYVDRAVVLDAAGTVRWQGEPARLFAEHADEIEEAGVWMPTAVRVGRRLAEAGVDITVEGRVPLTPEALGERLAECPALPSPAGPSLVPSAVSTRSTEEKNGPDAAAISVAGLTIRGNDRDLLHDVSLTVSPGEFLAIAGVNGAGKTTLARTIAGVRKPPRGTVHIGTSDVAELSSRQISNLVGFVFQNPEHQFVASTVSDELAHGLRVRRVPADEITGRVDDMMKRFGLTRYRDSNPFVLSHGEKRRLSVAAVLISEPSLLVLDEPTYGQDQARADELLGLLAEAHAGGRTVVIVTQDLQLAAEYADRLALLSDGRLVAHGPARELVSSEKVLAEAGLRPPPLRRLAAAVAGRHPEWRTLSRFADLTVGRVASHPTIDISDRAVTS